MDYVAIQSVLLKTFYKLTGITNPRLKRSLWLIGVLILSAVQVQAQNNDPVFTSTAVTSVVEGDAYTYSPTATDTDGDVLTFTAPTLPSWLTFESNPNIVTTFAGSGSSGTADGTGTSATFNGPAGLALDNAGNIYIADAQNHLIRKMTPAGVVTTVAGTGATGSADGTGTSAAFNFPIDLDIDDAGNLYVAEFLGHRIRKIDPSGVVTTIAGSGNVGSAVGTGTSAEFNQPAGIVLDASGNLFVTDAINLVIKKITPAGVVTTFAGNYEGHSDDGSGSTAGFSVPKGIAIDAAGNFYVSEEQGHKIRKVTSSGVISTIAGSGTGGTADGSGTAAQFRNPWGISVDSHGNIFVSDLDHHLIRKVTSDGVVSTIAGNGSAGNTDGTGTSSDFNLPIGNTVDGQGNLYIGNYIGQTVRKIALASTKLTGSSTGQAGDHNVTLRADDGNGGTAEQSFVVAVTAANAAPVVDLNGATSGLNTALNYDENAYINIAPSGTVSDSDNDNITSMTVTITNATQSFDDFQVDMDFQATAEKTAATNAGVTIGTMSNGVMNITGSATAQIYQDILQNLKYSNSSDVPPAETININVVVNDGTVNSTTAISALTIIPFNDGSSAFGTAANPTFTEGGVAQILFTNMTGHTQEPGETITGFKFTVTNVTSNAGADEKLTVDGTAIALNNTNSGTTGSNSLSYSVALAGSTATVTLSGGTFTASAFATLLEGVKYENVNQNPASGGRLVTLSEVTDSGAQGAGHNNPWATSHASSTVTVAAVNDPSVFTSATTGNFAENGTGTAYTITATDVESTNFTYALGTGNDTDKFNITNNLVTFKTAPDFENPIDGDGNNTYIVEVKVTENGVTVMQNVTITVTDVQENTAPVVDLDGATSGAINENGSIGIADYATVTDADNDNIVSMTITVTGYTGTSTDQYLGINGATNTIATNAGVTVGAYDTNTGTLSITGSATAATYQSILRGIAYGNNSDTPPAGDVVIHIEVNDGTVKSSDVTNTINITPVNDDPTFTSQPVTTVNDNATYTYNITTSDAEGNNVTVTKSAQPSWLTLGHQVSTFAGSSASGTAEGTGTSAQFALPTGVAIDSNENLYIADYANSKIRKITPAGVVSTYAGSTPGALDGTALSSQFAEPYGIAVDKDDNVYVTDRAIHTIRKITPGGMVSTLAGSNSGFANGSGSSAQFNSPEGIAVDAAGNLYVADANNHKIRKITPAGEVSTWAGAGSGYQDGPDESAKFANPRGIAIDAAGNLYVTDKSNHKIRKIRPDRVVTTFAGAGLGYRDGTGSNALFNEPSGIAIDKSGNLYVGDEQNKRIRIITTTGVVSTLAGSTIGLVDGVETSAKFDDVTGLAVDASGNLFATDRNNNSIRKINLVLTGDATGQVAGSQAVTLTANDGKGGTTPQTYNIDVVDATNPSFTSSTTVNFAENGTGTAYTVAATDANAVTYSLGTGNDEALFNINGGVVTFKAAPDFETPGDGTADGSSNTYLINVVATDAANNAVNQNVTITIINIDDTAPVFTSATAVNFAENGTGTAYTVAATDGNSVTYSLGTGNDEALFNINAGVITFKAVPDFETPGDGDNNNTYVINVIATDGANNAANQNVTITVTNIDDTAPVITSTTAVNFAENGTGTVYTVTATDANAVTYALGAGNDGTLFNINGAAVTFKVAPDFETPGGSNTDNTYVVNVVAVDANNNASSQDVTVTVTNLNDNNPVFTSTAVTAVNTEAEYDYAYAATDGDGDQLTFTAPTLPSWLTFSAGSILPNVVTTLAGGGTTANADGTGTAAAFSNISAMTTDSNGNVYVANGDNNTIRKITPTGVVTTLATNVANVVALAADGNGNVFSAETSKINKITQAGVVTTFIGSGIVSLTDMVIDSRGTLYWTDLNSGLGRLSQAFTNGSFSIGEVSAIHTKLAVAPAPFVPPPAPAAPAAPAAPTPPGTAKISSVSSVTPGGAKAVGDVIEIKVNFSEAVNVTGTPQLTLETGDTDRIIDYSGGSGTTTLIFNYTIQQGDKFKDLNYVDTNSLTLGNGGSIKSAIVTSNDAVLTLPSITSGNALAFTTNFSIGHPVVTNVSSTTADGTKKLGDAVEITVTFSEAVNVTGTPKLLLETGSTDRSIAYNGTGSGTNTVSFIYTVQTGDNSTDLDYQSASALTLEGGTIKDADGDDAIITLPTPASTGSLAANKALVIDAIIEFNSPSALAIDKDHNLFVVVDGTDIVKFDAINAPIAPTAPNAVPSAPAPLVPPTTNVDFSGFAQFDSSLGKIAIGEDGLLYAFETGAFKLQQFDANGKTTVFAGSGSGSRTDGIGTAATFTDIKGLAIDSNGNLYAAESDHIRQIKKETTALKGTAPATAGTHNVVLRANDSNGGTTEQSFTITVNDVTAPTFSTDPFPPTINATSILMGLGLNEAGKAYYVVLADGATAPTAAEVKAGTGSAGAAVVTSANADITDPNGGFSHSFDVTGLADNTDYDIYVIAEDAPAGNLQATPFLLEIKTLDGTAPAFSSTTTATFAENGTGTVYTIAATDVNAVTYTLGTGNDEALFNLNAGVVTFKAAPDFETPGGSNTDNTYVINVIATDASNNASNQNVTITVTDVDEVLPVISSDIRSALNPNANEVDITFSEGVFGGNGTGPVEPSDFTLQLSNNTAVNTPVISAITNTSGQALSGGETVLRVSFGYTGTAKGDESLTFKPAANAIFDAAGNAAATTQTHGTLELHDETFPTITGITLGSTGSHNTSLTYYIDVDFSEAVSGITKEDFTLSFSSSQTALTHTVTTKDGIALSGGETAVRLNLSFGTGQAEGNTINMMVANNTIFDRANNPVGATNLNTSLKIDQIIPSIGFMTVDANNSVLTTSFTEKVFGDASASAPLEVDDLSISISGGTATGVTITSITNASDGALTGGEEQIKVNFSLSGTPNGKESVTLDAASSTSIFDEAGFNQHAPQGDNVNKIDLKDIYNPVFTSTTTASFVENGTGTVYTAAATDGNAVTYTLGTGNDEALFNINAGVITFKNAPDFETPGDGDNGNTYVIEVQANDGLNTAKQTVTITVTDVDEILPVFTSATTRLYRENGINSVYIVSANDANALTFTLGTGNDETLFNINAGEVTFKTAPDFENPADGDQNNDYVIEVQANDGLNTAMQTVTITVTDIDEIDPVFTSANTVNFAEGGKGAAYTPVATDANEVTYTLGKGNDETLFDLKGGVVNFLNNPDFERPADADRNNTYVIEVLANDGLNIASQTVTITVTDVDEIDPVFTSATAVNFAENGTGTAYTIAATDDIQLTYTIATTKDYGKFNVSDGIVTFAAAPDFETPGDADGQNTYEIDVNATDGLNTATQTVVITVTDVDEIDPVFTSATAVNFAENGTGAAYTIAATDDNQVTYTIATTKDYGKFNVSDGLVTFAMAPDFETPTDADGQNTYEIDVNATDGLNTATQTVVITVTDVDEIDPVFTSATAVNFAENGTGAAYTIAATDDNQLTYTIATTKDYGKFNVSDGVVTFATAPDFETPTDADGQNTYEIDVNATDGLNTATQTVVITVTDVDEIDPVFTSATAVNFAENGTAAAYTIAATDDNQLTYTIATTKDYGKFNVSDGVVTFATAPDFETPTDADGQNTYEIDVNATDGLNTATQTVVITVTDVDEIDPVFTSATAVNFAENGTGTAYTIAATDDNQVTYTIATTKDYGKFNVSDGLVTFAMAPDFETPGDADGQNTYEIDVNATDGLNTATQTVVITVTDVDEIDPVFTSATAVNFAENGTGAAYTIAATDDNQVTYTIATTKDYGKFNVSDGLVTFATAPDFETPTDADGQNTYEIDVNATDGLNTATQTVVITVTDVDEIDPVFTSATAVNFAENGTGAAYTIAATDDNQLTYTIATTKDYGKFNVSDGLVTFATAPDFETPTDADGQNTYEIDVNATDGLNTATQTVVITVTDVDEIDPVFTSATAVDFAENGTSTAYTIAATDDNQLTYTIATTKDYGKFNVSGGIVTFATAPDFETPGDADGQNTYEIDVNASDGLNTATQTVVITVTDVDEIDPVFTSATAVNFAENGTGAAYTIAAADANAVTYALGTGNDEAFFTITDGVVSFVSSPDFETPADANTDNAYVIDVQANDGLNTATQTVTITVTNVDDTDPVFTSATSANYAENGTGAAYTASAADANAVTYALGTGNDEAFFTITDGVVSFVSSPDFETPADANTDNAYVIDVQANDGLNTATQTVTITVTNVDDTDPVFTSATAVDFAENGTGTAYTVAATDANALTYSLGTGNDEALFSINDGAVTFNTAPDFEAPVDGNSDNAYVINVIASDGINSVNQNVTITVTDVQEDVTGPTVSITGPGITSGAFTATITFNEAVTGFALEDISVSNGVASNLTGSGTDYSATITPAADGNTTVDIAASTLQDEVGNDNSAATQFSIENDETAPTVTVSSNVSDLVFASSIEVTFTFSEAVTDFTASDIALTNAVASNFTGTGTSYTADIAPIVDGAVTIGVNAGAATDQAGNANTLSNSLSKIIEATNEAPTAIDLSTALVTENTAAGFEVGVLTATDADISDAHSYKLVSGTGSDDNGAFTIIGASLLTSIVPDFESKNSYSVRIRVTDTRGLTFDAVKTIVVANLDEPVLTVTITDPADATKTVSDLNFENTRTGQTSTRSFELSNTGTDGDLVVTSVQLTSGFTISESAFTLTAGSSKTVTATFAPTADQTYSGTMTIASNVADANVNIAGLGLVNNAPVAVTPASTFFLTLGQTIELNGYDPDGDAIAFEIVTQPTLGTLTATATAGIYSYVPNAGLAPETLHQDVITFKVVEAGGGLESANANFTFNFEVADKTHQITALSVTSADAENINFSLDFEDEIINNTYTYEVSYYDQSLNTFETFIDASVGKSDLSISNSLASFGFSETKTNQPYLFNNETVILLVELNTGNGFSDAQAFLLENTVDGTGIVSTINSRSETGDFVVFASETSVPENESIELNLFAVEFDNFSLADANLEISKEALSGSTSNLTTVQKSDRLAHWTLTYTPETEIGLLDSIQFSVFSPERDDVSATYARIQVVEVADAPVLVPTADLQINEEEYRTLDLNITDPDSEYEILATSSDPANVPVTVVGDQLQFSPVLNYNGTVNISVIVQETNEAAPLSTFDQFELVVAPVNDKPVMTALDNLSMDEDTKLVVTLAATDVDVELPVFSYAANVANDDNVAFEIDGNQLTISPAADFSGTLSFSVTADDGLNTSSSVSEAESFEVTVNPVNDAPTIKANLSTQSLIAGFPSYNLNLAQFFEDQETASDQLTYTVSSLSNVTLNITGAIMTVNPVSGSNGVETATIAVSDGSLSVQQDVTFVTTPASTEVTVANPIADLTLDEDFGTKTIDLSGLFSYSADANAVFSYSLSGNSNIGASMNGQVLELTSTANFNGSDELYIVGSTDGKSSFTSFSIAINAINDEPVLNSALSDETVAEDAAFTKVISTSSFTDIDNDALTYAANYSADWLSFDATTRTFTGTPANGDVGNVAVVVTVTDAVGATATDSFDIVVNNVNDNPTSLSITEDSMAENLAIGTNISTLNSTDIDAGDDAFTYALVSGTGDDDNELFAIAGDQLTTAAAFDFETRDSYSVRIRTTDGFEGSFTQVFTISVSNVNEVATDLTLSADDLAENLATGTTVASLSSIDPDQGDSHTYALATGTGDDDNASFTIANGELKTAADFDFESKDTYSIRLQSTDAAGLSFEKQFTLSITDENEAATDISLSATALDENRASGVAIADLTTVDEDARDSHTYTLVSGEGDTDNAVFDIEDGALVATQSYDFESKSSYSIRLRTTDEGGLSYEEVFTISINDVNETATDIALSNAELAENNSIGAEVGSFTTSDPDAGDAHTYTLVSGTGDADNGAFEIVDNQLVAAVAFDFETKESYTVRIRTTDAAGLFYEEAFDVTIVNVPDPLMRLESTNPDEPTALGLSTTINVSVFNDGDGPLNVSTIWYPEGFSGPILLATIEPGSSAILPVVFTPTEAKTYEGDIVFNYNGGALALSVSAIGQIVTAIDNGQVNDEDVKLYPNPAVREFVLDLKAFNGDPVDISIITEAGASLYKIGDVRTQSHSINVSQYGQGIYMVLIQADKQLVRKKLMIRR